MIIDVETLTISLLLFDTSLSLSIKIFSVLSDDFIIDFGDGILWVKVSSISILGIVVWDIPSVKTFSVNISDLSTSEVV